MSSSGRLAGTVRALLGIGECFVYATPLFAAYLKYAPLPPGPISLHVWKLTALVVVIFSSWSLFQKLMISRLREAGASSSSRLSRVVGFLALFLVAAILLSALSQLRSLATQQLFVGVLGIVTVRAVAAACHHRRRPIAAISLRVFFYTLVGSLSFLLRTGEIYLWQPVVFSLGLALVVELVNILALLRAQGENPTLSGKQWKIIVRLVAIFVVAAPNCFAILCYLLVLEKKYLITLIILVQGARPLAQLYAAKYGENLPDRLIARLRVLPIEFVVALVLVRLL